MILAQLVCFLVAFLCLLAARRGRQGGWRS